MGENVGNLREVQYSWGGFGGDDSQKLSPPELSTESVSKFEFSNAG